MTTSNLGYDKVYGHTSSTTGSTTGGSSTYDLNALNTVHTVTWGTYVGGYGTVYQSQWSGGVMFVDDYGSDPLPPVETIISGEIVAWRMWIVDTRLMRLRSVAFDDFIWEPGQPARGKLEGHHIGSGIHAFKSVKVMKSVENYKSYFKGYLEDAVYGQVRLWGDVMEHEDGYRAEYARPLSLHWTQCFANLKQRNRDTLRELRRLYLEGR